jgi:PAS domain-containing protein
MELLLKEIEKVKALLQRVPEKDLFFIKDFDGHYIWMNNNAEKFIGKSLSEIFMQRNIWKDDIESEVKMLSGEIPWTVRRYRIKRPADGRRVFMNVFKTLLVNPEDKPVGILITAHEESAINNLMFCVELMSRLFKREREFIIHSLNNRKNKSIAEVMKVSESSISGYKKNIVDKFNMKDEEYELLMGIIYELLNDITEK